MLHINIRVHVYPFGIDVGILGEISEIFFFLMGLDDVNSWRQLFEESL